MSARREKRVTFPLRLVIIKHLLEQQGINVVGEINPNSLKLHKYILTTTDYFTKWIEVIPLKTRNENEVIQFFQRNFVMRFEVPNRLDFNNPTYFSSVKIVEYALEHNINLNYSTNYYLQGNGIV